MIAPVLDSRSRVMMFAPHPDDESLAAGVFLQGAVAAGAEVRIVYATDGEKNCWPQRFLERKVRIHERDRRRWGERRRAEALDALSILQIDRANVEFLSLPDQGVTDLLLDGCGETVGRLAETIVDWEPTHLLVPSAGDTHPDHSGLAVLLGVVFDNFLPSDHEISRLHYLVHGASASFARGARYLPQTLTERKTKRRAIACHVTQVALSRRRFLAYANRPERFVFGEEDSALACDGPIRFFARDLDQLRLQVAFSINPLRAEETTLYLIGHGAFGGLRRLRTTLPGRTTKIDLIDCATGALTGVGQYRGDAFRAEIFLPMHGFAPSRPVFAKLDRRVWFFDEAGWTEIGATIPKRAVAPARQLPQRHLAVA